MSWGTVSATTTLATFDQDLNKAKADYLDGLLQNDYSLDAAAIEQVDAAIAAAKSIASSGAIGAPDASFAVQLSGHANPSHAPVPGWANDCVTVYITQATPPAAAVAPAEAAAAQDQAEPVAAAAS